MDELRPPPNKTCERCGQPFSCDIARGEKTCWCFVLPQVMPLKEKANCLCPECLKREIAARTAAHGQSH